MVVVLHCKDGDQVLPSSNSDSLTWAHLEPGLNQYTNPTRNKPQSREVNTYSNVSARLLFCVSLRKGLIGQLSASAPPAARYWELLHCGASSYPAGNLSFCQHKGFPPPPGFKKKKKDFAKSTFLRQLQRKPAIWYIQGVKCSMFNISSSLAYSFGGD